MPKSPGRPYIRVDAVFTQDDRYVSLPKAIRNDAYLYFLALNGHSRDKLTDGRVKMVMADAIARYMEKPAKRMLTVLVDSGLILIEGDEVVIPKYAKWQDTKGEVESARAAAKKAGSAGGRRSAQVREDRYGTAQPNSRPEADAEAAASGLLEADASEAPEAAAQAGAPEASEAAPEGSSKLEREREEISTTVPNGTSVLVGGNPTFGEHKRLAGAEPNDVPPQATANGSAAPKRRRSKPWEADAAFLAFIAELNAACDRRFNGDTEAYGLFGKRQDQGWSQEDLLAAARGAGVSPHHCGHNEQGVLYQDPATILRSKQFQTLIQYGRGEVKPRLAVPRAARDSMSLDAAWAAEAERARAEEEQLHAS